jgi:small subunit ribosomal protein S16
MNQGLKFKLCRFGKKHQPVYRIGVMPVYRNPSRQHVIEYVGFYNPKTKEFRVDKDKVDHYTKSGASFSDTVRSLFVKNKVI